MTGNPCGDYTLSLEFPENEAEDVCTEGVLHKGELEENESLTMDLWFQDSSYFSLTCYLWCTEDGHLPKESIQASNSSESNWFLSLVKFEEN